MTILQKTSNYGTQQTIKSLMVNYGLNWRNPRLKTKIKKMLKSSAEIEVQ